MEDLSNSFNYLLNLVLPPDNEEHFLTAHLGEIEVVAPLVESVPITAYLGATTQPPVPQPSFTANEQQRARKVPKSPNIKTPDKPRGRSPAKNPSSTARSSSYEAEIEILQYYSDRSTSPVQTSVRMPSIYRRPLIFCPHETDPFSAHISCQV